MKIRTGFVSNSSSSSFCIFGVAFDTDRFKKLKMYQDKLKELAEKEGVKPEDYEEDYGVYEVLDCFKMPEGFTIREPSNFDTVYVGREWKTICDDETGAQFKESVRKVITEMFGDQECGTIEEAWYDG